jgi:hypothetical protein
MANSHYILIEVSLIIFSHYVKKGLNSENLFRIISIFFIIKFVFFLNKTNFLQYF